MISIVIPTYNESSTIGPNLEKMLSVISSGDEIIVVDGLSEDCTAEKVKEYKGVTLVENSVRGRAVQMNRGAREAAGEYILFLHADTT